MEGNTTVMDYGMTANSSIWMMMIFLLLVAGGRGFGFGGAGVGAAGGMINNDFLYTNLNSALGQGFTQITNQNFGLERAMAQGFANQAQCCCETNRNIDGIRADLVGATGQIMANNDKNTQAILGAICDLKTEHLKEEVQKLRDEKLALINEQNISRASACTVNAIRPYPTPAFVVNPYPLCPITHTSTPGSSGSTATA